MNHNSAHRHYKWLCDITAYHIQFVFAGIAAKVEYGQYHSYEHGDRHHVNNQGYGFRKYIKYFLHIFPLKNIRAVAKFVTAHYWDQAIIALKYPCATLPRVYFARDRRAAFSNDYLSKRTISYPRRYLRCGE